MILASLPLALASEQPVRVLLLGDSLSASYGMAYEEGWVPRMQQLLDTEAQPVRIINASISGETTGGGQARLARLLQEHQPHVLWIELGGNDGLRGYPPPSIQANIESMIRMGQEQDARVWITRIEIPPNYGPRYNERFRSLFTELAENFDLPLLPFPIEDVALNPDLMMPDGIHPTSEAQPRIAEKMRTAVLQTLMDQELLSPPS